MTRYKSPIERLYGSRGAAKVTRIIGEVRVICPIYVIDVQNPWYRSYATDAGGKILQKGRCQHCSRAFSVRNKTDGVLAMSAVRDLALEKHYDYADV